MSGMPQFPSAAAGAVLAEWRRHWRHGRGCAQAIIGLVLLRTHSTARISHDRRLLLARLPGLDERASGLRLLPSPPPVTMSKKGCRITADRRRVAFAIADARKSARDDCSAAAWLKGSNGNCPVRSLAQDAGSTVERMEKKGKFDGRGK